MILSVLFLLTGNFAYSQGNLILMQKRVVFSGNTDGIKIIDFGNIGNETADYEVSLINLRMTENGQFETITEPDSGQFFATDNIRYYPHSMIISPNGAQTMKIQLVDATTLKPGEYRSHLYFRAKPGAEADNSLSGPDAELSGSGEVAGSEVNISVRTEFGIAIPVIIRIGESTTTNSLSHLRLENTGTAAPQVLFTLERSGNFSSYGHITVTHISPDGSETVMGSVMGVAVYTPCAGRNCALSLSNLHLVDITQGSLRVEFFQPAEDGGALLAKSELKL